MQDPQLPTMDEVKRRALTQTLRHTLREEEEGEEETRATNLPTATAVGRSGKGRTCTDNDQQH